MKQTQFDKEASVPILMYHEVAPQKELIHLRNRLHTCFVVTTETFESQMRWLSEHGFQTISLPDVIMALQRHSFSTLPEKPIIITFDDGYKGNRQHAFPILKQYHMTATVFVVVSQIGHDMMMDWDDLALLSANGIHIESHLMHHTMLGELDNSQSFEELSSSKTELKTRLGYPVRFCSLPNGSYHRHYPKLALQAGYRGGCTSKIGYVSLQSHPFFLERVVVRRDTSQDQFKRLASGDHTILRLARIRQNIRKSIERFIGESTVNKLYHSVFGVKESQI